MSCDVEIKIFGKVSDPEAIWDLTNSAAAEGKIDWLFDFDQAKFVAMLEEAAREGRAITLNNRGTTDLFEGVRENCQTAGLAYVITFGDRGAEGFTNGIAWNPGMEDEFEFLLHGQTPVLKLEDVKKAAKQGIEAVSLLVERLDKHVQLGKIEIEPGFDDAFEEYSGHSIAPSM